MPIMTVIRDDEGERVARIEKILGKLHDEMESSREESRIVAEQMGVDSRAAAVRARQARSKTKAAQSRVDDISQASAKRTRRKLR
jgi:hypothetical protein